MKTLGIIFFILLIGVQLFAGTQTGDIVNASLLGALITGAGVQTTFSGQAQCEQYILIGAVDTANPLRGVSVEIDGSPFINIQTSLPLMSAFMQWQMEAVAGAPGFLLKISTGMIATNTTYRFTNNGATTPSIFVYSDSQNGVPIIATTKGITASSFEDFSKFSALFLTLPASISSVEIVWSDGHKSTETIGEVDSYFALSNQTDALGRLTAVSVIDNTDQMIKSVRVFASVVATVLVVKLPNQVFEDIKDE